MKKIENNRTLAPGGAAILSFHFFTITGCQILMSGPFAVTFAIKMNFYFFELLGFISYLHSIVTKFPLPTYRDGVNKNNLCSPILDTQSDNDLSNSVMVHSSSGQFFVFRAFYLDSERVLLSFKALYQIRNF